MKTRVWSAPHFLIFVLGVSLLFLSPVTSGQALPLCTATNLPTNVSAWLSGPGTTVTVIDVGSSSPVCQINLPPNTSGNTGPLIASPVTFSADGKDAYVMNANSGTLFEISTADGSTVLQVGPIYNPQGATTSGIVLSPDQTQIYVTLINVSTNGFINTTDSVFGITADGKSFLGFFTVDAVPVTGITTSKVDGHVYVSTPTKLFQITPGATPVIDSGTAITSTASATGQALVASPNGATIYVLDATQITPFDVATHTALSPISLPVVVDFSNFVSLAITPDGAKLFIGDQGLSQVDVYDISSATFGPPIQSVPSVLRYLSVSPDNSVAYILSQPPNPPPNLTLTFVNPATQVASGTLNQSSASPYGFAVTGRAATLAISTTTLPVGQVNTAYTATFAATGGTPPYSWAISSGNLPAGLALNDSTGVISGTPTTAGVTNFTVQVTDSKNLSTTANLSITVSGNAATLIVLPQPKTVAYGTSLFFCAQDASGNPVPVTWSVSSGPGTITPKDNVCPVPNQTNLGPGVSYQAPTSPPSGSTSQSVVVKATPLSGSCPNPTTNCSVAFTLTGTNSLSACCTLPLQLTTTVGSTTMPPTGVQLTGVPKTSTVPFTLSCNTLDAQGNIQPMPQGSGCIFTLPPLKGGGPLLAFNTISGISPVAACYVFTTGPTTTGGMAIPSSPAAWPQSTNRLRYSLVTLLIGICAVLFGFSRQKVQNRSLYVTTAVLGLVCISVSLLGACTGFSPANSVTSPAAQVTPAAKYRVLIQATPASGSPFTQTQLIVPLTVN